MYTVMGITIDHQSVTRLEWQTNARLFWQRKGFVLIALVRHTERQNAGAQRHVRTVANDIILQFVMRPVHQSQC